MKGASYLSSVARAVALAAVAVSGGASAEAAVINVTTAQDEMNDDGDCSLREAVQAANLGVPVDACSAGNGDTADTIKLAATTYALSIRGFPEDDNLSGDLDILGDVLITGDPLGGSTIDAGPLADGDHVLEVLAGRVELRDLTLTGSRPSFSAQGSIEVAPSATLVLRRCAVIGNEGTSGSFGILVHGRLEARDSIISGNRAAMGAGIFCLADATVELTRVTIASNHATYGGAGIDCSGGARLEIRNSSVLGNTTGLGGNGGGAGVVAATHTVIEDSTIADNITGFSGGGPAGGLWIRDDWVAVSGTTISGNSGSPGAAILVGSPGAGGFGRSIVLLENVTMTENQPGGSSRGTVVVLESEALLWLDACTLAGNFGSVQLAAGSQALLAATVLAAVDSPACEIEPAARVTSLGDNLEDGSSCGLDHPSDLTDTDPMLGVLAGSGGVPQTMVPLVGSPVVDSASWAHMPPLDQRQVTRPQDGDHDGLAVADRGAVEYVGDVLFVDGFERGATWRWSGDLSDPE